MVLKQEPQLTRLGAVIEGVGGGKGEDDGVEGGINKVSVERVEELKGLMEVVAVCMEGDDGVPNDDILVPR